MAGLTGDGVMVKLEDEEPTSLLSMFASANTDAIQYCLKTKEDELDAAAVEAMLFSYESSPERSPSPAMVPTMAKRSLMKEDTVTTFLIDSATFPTRTNKADKLQKTVVRNNLKAAVSRELSTFFKDAASVPPRSSCTIPSSSGRPSSDVSLGLKEDAMSGFPSSLPLSQPTQQRLGSRSALRSHGPIKPARSPSFGCPSSTLAKPNTTHPSVLPAPKYVAGFRPKFLTVPAKIYMAEQTDDEDQSMGDTDTDVDECASTYPVSSYSSSMSDLSVTTCVSESESEMDTDTVFESSLTTDMSDDDSMEVVEEIGEATQEVDGHPIQEDADYMEELEDNAEAFNEAHHPFDQALNITTGTAIAAIFGEDLVFDNFGTACGDDAADDFDDMFSTRSSSAQPSTPGSEDMLGAGSPCAQTCGTDTEDEDEITPAFSRPLGRTISLVSEGSRHNSPVPESHERRLERNLGRWPSLNTFASSQATVAPPTDAFKPSLYPGLPFQAIEALQEKIFQAHSAYAAMRAKPLQKTSSYGQLTRTSGGSTPGMRAFMARTPHLPTVAEYSSSSASSV